MGGDGKLGMQYNYVKYKNLYYYLNLAQQVANVAIRYIKLRIQKPTVQSGILTKSSATVRAEDEF